MKIPPQEEAKLSEIFMRGMLFGAIDSNLNAWLPQKWNATEEVEVEAHKLKEHKDNKELIEYFGDEQAILNKTLSPQQIKFLGENDALQTNGLSNLFFVYSQREDRLFIVGVVWDETIERFVPYIYRPRNLYRAWTKGNQVFITK